MTSNTETTAKVVCTCGHESDVTVKSPEYLDPKIARIAGQDCRDCRLALNARRQLEARIAAKKLPKSGQFPAGTLIAIKKADDGTWKGTLAACDRTAVASDLGIQKVIVALMRQADRWVHANYVAGPVSPGYAAPPIRLGSRSIIDKRGSLGIRQKLEARKVVVRENRGPFVPPDVADDEDCRTSVDAAVAIGSAAEDWL